MDSMGNFRERIEALEQQRQVRGAHARIVEQQLRWWRGIACAGLLVSLLNLAPPSQAADFVCTAGDVVCLINAINTANANGEANTITLDVGTYTLGTVDNDTDGPNGLPSITSALTIRGVGANSTIIERSLETTPPAFRIVHVAAAGTLTLTRVTVRGGLLTTSRNPGGAGILNLGSLTLTHSTIAHNTVQQGGIYSAGGSSTRGGSPSKPAA